MHALMLPRCSLCASRKWQIVDLLIAEARMARRPVRPLARRARPECTACPVWKRTSCRGGLLGTLRSLHPLTPLLRTEQPYLTSCSDAQPLLQLGTAALVTRSSLCNKARLLLAGT